MKRFVLILLVMATLAVTGCHKEEIADYRYGHKVIVTANINGNSSTKVTLTPSTDDGQPSGNPIVKISWEDNGEEFRVWGENAQSEWVYETFTQVQANKFEGSFPENKWDAYTAIYPASDEVYPGGSNEAGIGYNANLFKSQNGKLSKERTLMLGGVVASSNPLTINFRHLTILLKTQFVISGNELTPDKIKEIVFKDMLVNDGTADFVIDCSAHGVNDDIYVYLPISDKFYCNNGWVGEKKTLEVVVTDVDNNEYEGSITLQSGQFLSTGKLYSATFQITEIPYEWNNTQEATDDANIKGDGTEDNPFLITNANDLQWLIEYESAVGEYFKLTHNLSINSTADEPWIPIGKDTEKPFNGTFDGNGYSITGNLYSQFYSSSSSTDIYFGIFGVLGDYATVNKLTLDVNVYGGISSSGKSSYTGAVAGLNLGVIDNCTIAGSVKGGEGDCNFNTGGLVGINKEAITNCSNSNVVIAGISANNGNSLTGGYVGTQDLSSSIISNCTNAGNITGGISGSNAGSSYTGGFVGNMINGIVSSCINSGMVTGGQAPTANNIVGGITGDFKKSAKMYNCTNRGNITGGIIGKFCNTGGLMGSCQGEVKNCINEGNVTGGKAYISGSETLVTGGCAGTGGLTGTFPDGSIEKCINRGKISAGIGENKEGVEYKDATGTLIGMTPSHISGWNPKMCGCCKSEETVNGSMNTVGWEHSTNRITTIECNH